MMSFFNAAAETSTCNANNFFQSYFVDNSNDNTIKNYVFVSEELVAFINDKLENENYNKKFRYHYLYFCSTISYLQCTDKRNREKEYVSINYKVMTSIISRTKYPEIISNLKSWGIIDIRDYYHVGYESKGYKLSADYHSNLKRILIKDRLINKKLNIFRSKRAKEILNCTFPYRYVAYNLCRIKMNAASANKYNQENFLSSSIHKYQSNLYAVSTWDSGMFHFTVDDTGHRAHTNLTNLRAGFRSFLSVDGSHLGQIDFKNSQPFFFFLHLKDLKCIDEDEKVRYRQIVEDGKFYEFFLDKLKLPLNNRNKFKQKILTAIFSDKNRSKESRYMKVFRETFPTITNYIIEQRKRDYKYLICNLQKVESDFVFEHVVSEFINRFGYRNEFISTIHDSIVVKTEMLDEAANVIEFCFAKMEVKCRYSVSKF